MPPRFCMFFAYKKQNSNCDFIRGNFQRRKFIVLDMISNFQDMISNFKVLELNKARVDSVESILLFLKYKITETLFKTWCQSTDPIFSISE